MKNWREKEIEVMKLLKGDTKHFAVMGYGINVKFKDKKCFDRFATCDYLTNATNIYNSLKSEDIEIQLFDEIDIEQISMNGNGEYQYKTIAQTHFIDLKEQR